jgi:hypothetical protein
MMNNYRLPFFLRGSRRIVPRFPASLAAGLYGYTFIVLLPVKVHNVIGENDYFHIAKI